MKHRLLSGILALACAFAISPAALAASSAPTLSGESQTAAATKIYDYKVLDTYSGDSVFVAVNERVVDSKGNLYTVADSSVLADTSLFAHKTDVTLDAVYVRAIKPAEYSKDGFTGNAYQIMLTKDYSGQQLTIGFSNTYTAKADTVLEVIPWRGTAKDTVELTVKKGAKLIADSKVILNSETILTSNYPRITLP